MIKTIVDFSNYSIDEEGFILNRKTNREVKKSLTEYGVVKVGLFRDGVQYTRSVKRLVAKYFVNGRTSIFDTPMLLDGDENNIHHSNIVWRPRWFSCLYKSQFPVDEKFYYGRSIQNVTTGQRYNNIFEVCVKEGLLLKDVAWSLETSQPTFPNWDKFIEIF